MIKLTFIMFLICIISLNSYASPNKYECIFPNYADEQGEKKSSDFSITFVSDSKNEKYYILGVLGVEELIKIDNEAGGFSFLEITPSGNLAFTTIDKSLKAVHSRNMIIGEKLLPSQYYGKCKVL